MRPYLFLLFLLTLQFTAYTQGWKNCNGDQKIQQKKWDDWESPKKVELESDIAWLYNKIDNLNESTLDPFKIVFDSCRYAGNSTGCNDSLRKLLNRSDRLINKHILDIQDKFPCQPTGSKMLYYYMNKELKDYVSSLENLKSEMRHLLKYDKLNAFDNTNFISAFYNLGVSRSLLLAAINNMEFLMISTEKLDRRANKIDKTADSIKSTGAAIRATVSQNNTQLSEITQTHIPSIREENKKESRKWGLIGGAIGGLISGLLLLLAD